MLALAAGWHYFSRVVGAPVLASGAVRLVPVYAIGSISSYWVIDRTLGL